MAFGLGGVAGPHTTYCSPLLPPGISGGVKSGGLVEDEATTIGKAAGVLLTDDVFSRVAMRAKDSLDLADGVDEFLSATSLIPPAKWNPGARFEPPDDMSFVRTPPHLATSLLSLSPSGGTWARYWGDPLSTGFSSS